MNDRVKPRPYRLGKLPVGDIVDAHTAEHIAKVMNVHPRTVQRWRHDGVNGYIADKIAVKVCGTEAHTIWGADWARSFDEEDDAYAELDDRLYA